MRHSWTAVPLALVLGLPLGAAGPNDKNKDEKSQATPADYEALARPGKATGTIADIEEKGRHFTLLRKASGLSMKQQLLLEQQRALAIRNPVLRAQALQQVRAQLASLNAQGAAGGDQAGQKAFRLEATDEVKVRRKYLPVRRDENGKTKPYTQEERWKLKGKNKKLPYYEAGWDDLADGQKVEVVFKKQARKPAAQGAAGAAGGAAPNPAAAAGEAPPVRMIIILSKDKDQKEKPAKPSR